ncbi:NUDIX domain-containing protein [Candidatus Berkelbacteria bacterium]|nr:NUDIX domain-containing protein [Candidatus Berkelbacteria bacterium]
MKRSVVGLIFVPDYSEVLLITKHRPTWQLGRLNGPGGKLEKNESPLEAMVRELTEETALEIPAAEWTATTVLSASDWEVSFFTTVWTGNPAQAQSLTDEPVAWYPTKPLPTTVIDNLRWQIPMAINKLSSVDKLAVVNVVYSE